MKESRSVGLDRMWAKVEARSKHIIHSIESSKGIFSIPTIKQEPVEQYSIPPLESFALNDMIYQAPFRRQLFVCSNKIPGVKNPMPAKNGYIFVWNTHCRQRMKLVEECGYPKFGFSDG